MDQELFEKALKMPPNERLTLAELILASIEVEDVEVRDAWVNEVKDRISAVKAGKARLVDFDALYNAG